MRASDASAFLGICAAPFCCGSYFYDRCFPSSARPRFSNPFTIGFYSAAPRRRRPSTEPATRNRSKRPDDVIDSFGCIVAGHPGSIFYNGAS